MKALLAAGMLVLALPAGAAAYYCGTSLITEGDSLEAVLARCGRPAAWRQGGQPFAFPGPAAGQHLAWPYAGSPGDTSTLTYNCGEGTLIHVLTFWNGKLTRIETAGHGFGPGTCP